MKIKYVIVLCIFHCRDVYKSSNEELNHEIEQLEELLHNFSDENIMNSLYLYDMCKKISV